MTGKEYRFRNTHTYMNTYIQRDTYTHRITEKNIYKAVGEMSYWLDI